MTPSSSSTTVVDERGFIFKLPHLGLPDPTGEWVLVKAAIGTKAAALDRLVNDSSLKAPLREEEDDCEMTAFDFQGALWALPLLKPPASPNAPPQFFSLKVRRMFPDAMEFPRTKVPDHFDWVFYPMSVYEEQVRENASPSKESGNDKPGYVVFQGGTAAQAKLDHEKKKKRRDPNKEISEWQAFSNSIFEDDWAAATQLSAMLEAAKLGDPAAVGAPQLTFRLRIHPAPDKDYRSMDYAICRTDEPSDAKLPEERWKHLPPEATKPGAQRHFVNLCRKGTPHQPFTKEEWIQMHERFS